MSDAVTIVIVRFSRQQGQSLLHIGQDFRLEAGPDFPEHIHEAGQFGGPDSAIQSKPAKPPQCADDDRGRSSGIPVARLERIIRPKGTPSAMIDKLNAAMRKGVTSEVYLKRLVELGAFAPSDEEMSAAYLGKFVPSEIEKFRKMLAEKK